MPQAFKHPRDGLVGLHIMYRSLVDGSVRQAPDEVRSTRDD